MDSTTAHESRLLSLSPDLLGAVAFDGTLQFANPAWSATLGRSDDQIEGTSYLEFLHPDDREQAAEVIERLAAGEEVHDFVCRLIPGPDGERVVLWAAQPGAPESCFYVAGKDITERKRLEDELALRADRLEHINTELQEFAYIASHDLAEPLRMVTSYLELLQRRYAGQLDETADEFIGFAVGGAERMKALIDDLLSYSRVGSHDMQRVEVDLTEILGHVQHGLEVAIEEAGVQIEIAEFLAPAVGDRIQIGQLLQNLIANGVKFRNPDQPPVVRVTSTAVDDGVRIDVVDNGIGIPANQQDRIFKMFARLHGRDEYPGTGIGLALCRRIAERHGGTISVASEPGVGSTFSVWLPGGP